MDVCRRFNRIIQWRISYKSLKQNNVCEVCGKHIDKPIYENHWIYAECEECHQEWLDKRAKAFEAYENKIKENKAKSESNKS